MERTTEEIIKELECCSISYADCNNECQYKRDCDGSQILKDALALIQQLEAERDAFKEALGLMVYQYCVRWDKLDHMYMCAGETAFRVLGLEQYGDTRTLESWLFPECQEEET